MEKMHHHLRLLTRSPPTFSPRSLLSLETLRLDVLWHQSKGTLQMLGTHCTLNGTISPSVLIGFADGMYEN